MKQDKKENVSIVFMVLFLLVLGVTAAGLLRIIIELFFSVGI